MFYTGATPTRMGPMDRVPMQVGVIMCKEHAGTHIDALCHQAEHIFLCGGIKADASLIQAILHRPTQPMAKVRLLKSGVVIAERVTAALAQDQANTITNIQPDATRVLRWGVPDRATRVQMGVDDGATWATWTVDVTSGELQLDLTS